MAEGTSPIKMLKQLLHEYLRTYIQPPMRVGKQLDLNHILHHILIEEIVAYPDAMIEVKYRIRNRYRIASKAVEAKHDLRVCTATAVHTLRRIIFQRKRSATKTA